MFLKTIGTVVLIMSLSIFSFCGNMGVISAREARQQLDAFDMEAMAEEVMAAVKDRDAKRLRNMMGANTRENLEGLDEALEALLYYYEGEVIDYEYSAAGEQWTKESRNFRIRNSERIDFHTEIGQYRIWVDYEVVNTYSEEDKGISLLSIYNRSTEEMGPSIKAPPVEPFDRIDN
jgi:hypothetical protein